MKKLLGVVVGLFAFLNSNSAIAQKIAVTVECSMAEPLYAGIFEIADVNPLSWQQNCVSHASGSSLYLVRPSFTLAFNGVEYEASSQNGFQANFIDFHCQLPGENTEGFHHPRYFDSFDGVDDNDIAFRKGSATTIGYPFYFNYEASKVSATNPNFGALKSIEFRSATGGPAFAAACTMYLSK